MIDVTINDVYTAHFWEPLPVGLTAIQLREAIGRTKLPLVERPHAEPGPYLEDRLPEALERVAGRRYKVVNHHGLMVSDAASVVTDETFSIEAA